MQGAIFPARTINDQTSAVAEPSQSGTALEFSVSLGNGAASWSAEDPFSSTTHISPTQSSTEVELPATQAQLPYESSLESYDGMSARIAGDASESDRYLLRHYPYDAKDQCLISHVTYRRMRNEACSTTFRPEEALQDPPITFMVADESLAESGEPRVEKEDLDILRHEVYEMFSEEQSIRLFKLFFRYVYPYFPVLSQSWFFSPATSLISRIRSLPLSLLSATYATALPFLSYDDYLNTTLAHSKPSRTKLYRICWLAVTHELHAPSLSTLQACLLQQQRGPTNQYLPATPFKISSMGWTVGLAYSLGLNYDCSGWANLPPWERRVRSRVWWAVHSVDYWTSLGAGTPRLISSADFENPPLTKPTSLSFRSNNSSTSHPANILEVPPRCVHFYYLTSLSNITADIYESYYTVRACASTSRNLALSLELARPLRARLAKWRQAFSADFPLPASSTATTEPNGNVALDLAYLVANVTIFRALLRPLEIQKPVSPCTNGTSAARPISPQDEEDKCKARTAIYTGALMCCREAADLLESLVSASSVWNAFWHSWSQSNFAIVSTFLMQMLLLHDEGKNSAAESTLGDMVELVRRGRSAMRAGTGSGGWGHALMSLGLLRLDGLMVMFEGIAGNVRNGDPAHIEI